MFGLVGLFGLFFYSTTTLDPFWYQRLGTICLFLQLCSFSTSVFTTYKMRQIMLLNSKKTSWSIADKSTQNFETMQIFKRHLCLYYSSSFKLVFCTNNREKKVQNTYTLHFNFKKSCASELRAKNEGGRH